MITVLYHANCNDGSASALAAWLSLGDDAQYIPVQYGSTPPEIDGGTVYILDFSYSKEILRDLAPLVERIVIIDHHKTAREDLRGYIAHNAQVVYDIEECGATLSWRYFHGNKLMPVLFRYIKDRDLWQQKYEETDGIAKALQLHEDFRTWARFIDNPSILFEQGEAIQRFVDMHCAIFVEGNKVQQWEGYEVPVFNAPGFMISDLLHLALTANADSPFAVAYFDIGDKRIFSLRSRQGSDVDVSKIAKRYGGGGHKHAAGFSRNLWGGNTP